MLLSDTALTIYSNCARSIEHILAEMQRCLAAAQKTRGAACSPEFTLAQEADTVGCVCFLHACAQGLTSVLMRCSVA